MPTPCRMHDCNHLSCAMVLHFSGYTLPALCCQHKDEFMERLANSVSRMEGEEGLARFRAEHRDFHLFVEPFQGVEAGDL